MGICVNPWIEEHYLEDKGRIIEEYHEYYDDDDKYFDNDTFINYYNYEKYRYSCYKQFYDRDKHACCYCMVISHTPCAT